jgi:acetyltransferase-like isoleucine patch superfamily enzyme
VEDLRRYGRGVVIEETALIFHPENVEIGDDVYVGHQAILEGYHRNLLQLADGAWIGAQAFLHAGGGIAIGRKVGVGPGVKILTSTHDLSGGPELPIMEGPLQFAPVVIGDGSDIGVGAIIMPGVTIGRGAQVGAGALVTEDVRDGAIVVGSPAREIRVRASF